MVVDWLIRRAKRTPYFHIYGADGSLYMERYWLVPYTNSDKPGAGAVTWRRPLAWAIQRCGLAIRLHHIVRPDRDRALHDHPWNFWSVVLRWFYVEVRPVDALYPNFVGDAPSPQEQVKMRIRWAGSIAFRRATDRHRIVEVSKGGAWTLFITGRERQWWGFYTPAGKVYWRDYEDARERGE